MIGLRVWVDQWLRARNHRDRIETREQWDERLVMIEAHIAEHRRQAAICSARDDIVQAAIEWADAADWEFGAGPVEQSLIATVIRYRDLL